MKKITQTLTLCLRRVNPQPPTPSVVAFPRTERSHFYCCKVSLLAEKDFCVAHTANDTDQRPGHSICHSVQGRGGGGVLTRVCVGWVCVLAVRQHQTLTSAAGRALNTRHFCCMRSVMQIVQKIPTGSRKGRSPVFCLACSLSQNTFLEPVRL